MIPSSSKTRPITVDALVEALAMQPRGACTYCNAETGEIITLTDDDLAYLQEAEEEPDCVSDADCLRLRQLQEVVESEEWLQLPDRFEIHDWAIMEAFVQTLESDELREHLLEVLHGPGALRVFPQVMEHLKLFDQWNRYHRAAMASIARDWMDEHGISDRG